jgi:branched-chain amino acid transport system permease protein
MEYFGQLLMNGLLLGSIYALTAVAYTIVYGVVRLVNFAFGELFMLGAMISVTLMLPAGRLFGYEVALPALSFWLAVPVAVAVTAAIGAVIERVAYRPLRTAPRLAPLISSIAVSTLLASLAQMIWGAQQISMPRTPLASDEPTVLFGSIFVARADLVIVVTMIVTLIGFHLFVSRSRLGRTMRAAAESRVASLLVGIPADRVIMIAFAIGSAFAALAGILYAQSYGSVYPTMGFIPGLKALTAAVLGGIGSIPGAALGGIILGLVESLGAGYLPEGSAYRDAISFVILVLLLLVRPQGILGKPELNEVGRGSLLGNDDNGRAAGPIATMQDKLSALWAKLGGTNAWIVASALLGAVLLGAFIPSNYWLQILTTVLIYGMLASGLNVIVGFAGLLDLGFVAFWAVGSYVTAILFVLVFQNGYGIPPAELWWMFYPLLLVGGIVAALFGVLLGYPTLRLRGDYLAIMTLGFGEIVRIVATNWIGLTRGPMGIRGIPSPSIFGIQLGSPRALYFFALALSIVIVFFIVRVVRSKMGRAWVAIREDEHAAEAIGIDTARYKLLAYAFSAAIGGIVGVFYAHAQRYIGPGNFSVAENITLLLLIVVGGLGTFVGPFIGALIWVLFLQLSLSIPIVQSYPEIRYVFLGAALVSLMLFRPQGIAARQARPNLVVQP